MTPPARRPAGLEVRDVTFGYAGGFQLGALTFRVEPGEVFGVVGPNGSGKTTLLRLVTRVREPAAGRILLDGTPVDGLSRRALAREIAVVPQGLAAAFPITVEELVLTGRYPHGRGRLFDDAEDRARAAAALRLVGLEHVVGRPLDRLSGGERQRALLARALAQEPRLLLLDEPTSHLDLRHQREVALLLRRLNRDHGLTVVLVTHDLSLAGELADRLMLLAGGRLVQLGTPAEVLEEGTLSATYGCPVWVDRGPSGRPMVQVRWDEERGREPGEGRWERATVVGSRRPDARKTGGGVVDPESGTVPQL